MDYDVHNAGHGIIAAGPVSPRGGGMLPRRAVLRNLSHHERLELVVHEQFWQEDGTTAFGNGRYFVARDANEAASIYRKAFEAFQRRCLELLEDNPPLRSGHSAALILSEICSTIENTGGVLCTDGGVAPVADEDWVDLGNAYVWACEVLGREPRFAD